MRPRPSGLVIALSAGAAAGALLASAIGALTGGVGPALGPVVESVRREPVTLYGRGLYEHDSRFIGAGNRATDAVVLVGGLPLLLVSLVWYRRHSTAGALLLMGTLAFFAYVYATYAIGIAYNRLFLVYISTFAASLFALVTVGHHLWDETRDVRLASHRRLVASFMFGSAAVLIVVWGLPLVGALIGGDVPPRLDAYTTYVTYVIDLAVILPAAIAAGLLVLRGRAQGYVLAAALLLIEMLLAPLISLQTWSQVEAGEQFTTGEVVGPIAGFFVLALLATFVLVSILRTVETAHAVPNGRNRS